MLAVFAGTSEGRELCEALSAAQVPARAFTATDYGATLIDELPFVEVHAGRLDADAIARAIADCEIVVDATHPYAAVVSANIRKAAQGVGVRYVRIVRPRTDVAVGGVEVVEVASAQEAVEFLNGREGNVLLTTGSKDLSVYAQIEGCDQRVWPRFLPQAESVQMALDLGYLQSHLICMQGPFSHELNVALLRMSDARWLVTKDTGTVGGFDAKISATAEVGARVVLIRRPAEDEVGLTLEEAIAALVG